MLNSAGVVKPDFLFFARGGGHFGAKIQKPQKWRILTFWPKLATGKNIKNRASIYLLNFAKLSYEINCIHIHYACMFFFLSFDHSFCQLKNSNQQKQE